MLQSNRPMNFYQKVRSYLRQFRVFWVGGAAVGWVGAAAVLGVIIGAVVVVVVFGAYFGHHWIESPGVCTRMCHNVPAMAKSLKTYKASRHVGQGCGGCHVDPGIIGWIEGNVVAAMVEGWWYVNKDWPNPNHKITKVGAKNCMSGGCHKKSILSRPLTFRGMPFAHETHMRTFKGGKALFCTSCHAKFDDTPGHLAENPSTCFLCHVNKKFSDTTMGCKSCHNDLARIKKKPQIHAKHWNMPNTCTLCHTSKGQASKPGCKMCHASPDAIKKSQAMHKGMWNTTPCMNCHKGKVVELDMAPKRDKCANCHAEKYHTAKALNAVWPVGKARAYDGKAAHHHHLFGAHKVQCFACHDLNKAKHGGVGGHGASSVGPLWSPKKADGKKTDDEDAGDGDSEDGSDEDGSDEDDEDE